jgi:hypothetical protein
MDYLLDEEKQETKNEAQIGNKCFLKRRKSIREYENLKAYGDAIKKARLSQNIVDYVAAALFKVTTDLYLMWEDGKIMAPKEAQYYFEKYWFVPMPEVPRIPLQRWVWVSNYTVRELAEQAEVNEYTIRSYLAGRKRLSNSTYKKFKELGYQPTIVGHER